MADFNFYINRQGIRGRKGEKGERGFTPSISVNTDTLNEYTLDIANEFNTFTTPNLRSTREIVDEGGTYVRFNPETQTLSAGEADYATVDESGVVRLSSDVDIANIAESTAMTPANVADAIPQYLVSDSAELTIAQNEDTSITHISVDLSGVTTDVDSLELRVQDAENEIVGIQADVADLDADNSTNTAIINEHTSAIANINDSISSLQTNKQGKLTAGEGITIDENNVISAEGGGGAGDVTAAGDNNFTGANSFAQQVRLNDGAILGDYIPIEFGNSQMTGSTVMNRASVSNELTEHSISYPSGYESFLYANTLRVNGGYNLILDAGKLVEQDGMTLESYTYKGKILDGDGNVILSQGNVTAGEGVTINQTDDGIEIVASGGGIDTSNLVTLDGEQTITGLKRFSENLTFDDSYTSGKSIWMGQAGGGKYGLTFQSGNTPYQFVIHNQGYTASSLLVDGFGGGVRFDNTVNFDSSIYDKDGNEIVGGGGGSAPENMVTTDTAQTISSIKTIESGKEIRFNTANTSFYGTIAGGTDSAGRCIVSCGNTFGSTPEEIIIGAQGIGSSPARRGIFLSVPTTEAIYLGHYNSACKIEAVYDLKLYGGYSQNSYLHLSNDELKYTRSDGTSVDLLANAASAVSAASETGGVTGDLKDSTGTAIAKVENGIITEFYF